MSARRDGSERQRGRSLLGELDVLGLLVLEEFGALGGLVDDGRNFGVVLVRTESAWGPPEGRRTRAVAFPPS